MIEINNAAARQYVTMLENNVWMHFVAWQKKLIRVELMLTNLDKKTYKYVIAKMFQDANGASCGPNANKFKHPEVLEIGVPFFTNISHIYKKKKKILKRIHWTMRFIPHISTPKKDWYGITYIAHIKDNVRMFLQCGLLIANSLEELAPVYMEKFKKSLHIPQVIPQKNKKRHIWDHSDTTNNFVSWLSIKCHLKNVLFFSTSQRYQIQVN